MKGTDVKDFIAGLPKEEQDAIEQEYQLLQSTNIVLQELRKATGMTQDELADALEMEQGNLSKMEKRNDMLVSNMRRYVEALGGKLHIIAALPDKPLYEIRAE
jgi:DNA-binding XRE family transcriptional regulator